MEGQSSQECGGRRIRRTSYAEHRTELKDGTVLAMLGRHRECRAAAGRRPRPSNARCEERSPHAGETIARDWRPRSQQAMDGATAQKTSEVSIWVTIMGFTPRRRERGRGGWPPDCSLGPRIVARRAISRTDRDARLHPSVGEGG